jgi:hypothetical protein
MNERMEKLDRSMDFVLLFITVLSSALFQFISGQFYDISNKTQVSLHEYFMRFSLKLFFLPLLLIIPLWLVIHILRNDGRRMILRAFVWSFTTMVMALDAIALVVFVIPLDSQYLVNPLIIILTTVFVVFFLAEFFLIYMFREFRRALLTDLNVSIHFFQKRWEYAAVMALLTSSMLFFIILLVSIVA